MAPAGAEGPKIDELGSSPEAGTIPKYESADISLKSKYLLGKDIRDLQQNQAGAIDERDSEMENMDEDLELIEKDSASQSRFSGYHG